jgi:cyclic beta-1,2-glucan synthetase
MNQRVARGRNHWAVGRMFNRWFGVADPAPPAEQPLRAELFSADQMEQHGRTLAALHTLGARCSRDGLLERLDQNEALLRDTCALLTVAISATRSITPAGEWLLDNLYLVEVQIATARRHLPVGYSRELPRLARGESAGLPRVYDLALEVVAHGDGSVDPENLGRFVAAYQSVTPLALGELWGIPIMLRLALIENLRRVATRIAQDRSDRNLADAWADRMIEAAESDPKSVILMTADMARSDPPTSSSFVAELARRLQGQSPALALPLTWIEQRLAEAGLTIEQQVQTENQHQTADQVSIANSIGSLRALAFIEWRTFVESMSHAEQVLREDPAGAYRQMDFETRDDYRHALERMARRGAPSEVALARIAISLAQLCIGDGELRRAHVGHYLVGAGLAELEAAARLRVPLRERIRRLAIRAPLLVYVGAIAAVTASATAALLAVAHAGGAGAWVMLALGVAGTLASSQFSHTLVNGLSTLVAMPRALPRMDFSKGIPAAQRTLVVVPTMLAQVGAVERLVEALEVRFLGNRDPHVHFGLLTDLADAASEVVEGDALLVETAMRGIERLNLKYPQGEGRDAFFLFHRPRRWNPVERVWMGHERKRGKLGDLNALLRGRGAQRFVTVVGAIDVLLGVRFVITLDTDTNLPRDAARAMIGTMAHPLNRACYDEAKRRVTEGYGILQPRMAAGLLGANRSRYARMHSGEAGIDPYTRAVSDVYQDLFDEGSFIGKGIYDVDAFALALDGRLPDNRILSHDLVEGCFARSGLLSDTQLYEDYPSTYAADVSRRHRWIRGDWQIASWLLPRAPGVLTRGQLNPLSGLSRWKIVDNLRRSLVSSALFGLLLLGWFALPHAAAWTALVLAILATPAAMTLLQGAVRRPSDSLAAAHFASVLQSGLRSLGHAVFELTCLPFDAWFSLDAIVRTCYRVVVSRTRLLEWTASSEVERTRGSGLAASVRSMWVAPAAAACVLLGLLQWRPAALPVALPILVLWLLAPAIASWLGKPLETAEPRLDAKQRSFLRKVARRTWHYFESHVDADDNWLPPDNFQEQPAPIRAHRTSPTNIGLSLLANLAAHDFGYLGLGQLVMRTRATLETMQRLQRFRGHFFNWYDTTTLQPLLPRYVSAVDSGNLAGSLLTLRSGLLEIAAQPVLSVHWLEGLVDAMAVVQDTRGADPSGSAAQCAALLQVAPGNRPATVTAARAFLARFCRCAGRLAASDAGAFPQAAQGWTRALSAQCGSLLADFDTLLPWAAREVPAGLQLPAALRDMPSLLDVARMESILLPQLEQQAAQSVDAGHVAWLQGLLPTVVQASRNAAAQIEALAQLATQAAGFAIADYAFLYDETRHLLAIGFNTDEHRRDAGYYDLLASEARLTVFVAIAQGALPQEAWFAMGRSLTRSGGEPLLLSWSGSMFEYLMPMLVMPSYPNTLLDHSCRAAVRRQIEYGAQLGLPWGISESGYNAVDASFSYQYRAFGVPGLGLKRGLAADQVIAPYASALALMVAPLAACENLQALAERDMLGDCGFYEAIDFTPSRQRPGHSDTILYSFMAHHQGMSLLALAQRLLDAPMQCRFASDPLSQATLLLLHERVPRAPAQYASDPALVDPRSISEVAEMPVRVFNRPDTAAPAIQLLSNGRYHVMVSNAGGGYSRWRDLAVTRWREDATCDSWGIFCYLRDPASGAVWSNAFQPVARAAERYEAIFTEPRVEFRRRDEDFETHTEIVVSPEDDIELRRLRITNRGRSPRVIEVTSYAEVVMAPAMADALHPAFSNLFVQTQIVPARQAILCSRRSRSPDEVSPWMLHLMAVHGASSVAVSYETDRARFIGRGNSTRDPDALRQDKPLSGSDGAVLDPIVAIRHRIVIEPEQTAIVDLVTGVADTREAALGLIAKYRDRRMADRVLEMAWTHSHVVLRQINITEADAQVYGRLAGAIVHADAALRADPAMIASNRRGQPGLWGYAISGDLPIVLLQIRSAANIELVRQLVQAHAYWRMKGLSVDLVVWNEDRGGYRQVLHDQIIGLIAAGLEGNVIDRPGGIFVRSAEQISNEDRILLQAVARVVIIDALGSLADHVRRRPPAEPAIPRLLPSRLRATPAAQDAAVPQDGLRHFNGIGGFSADGREYIITTGAGLRTPAPWSNVLANPHFGCVLSDSGSSYTWFDNAHQFRLTPWHNDPVCDSAGEAIYVRDEDTGHYWSPTPMPRRGEGDYVCHHGFGYSRFEHVEDGIGCELVVHVSLDSAVKFSVLTLRNLSGRSRRLSATGYVEWVLGDLRSKCAMHVVTELDPRSGAILARNAYNPEFADIVAFFDVDDSTRTISGDRAEFIGRNGSLASPAAMQRARLSGKVGAAMDPCAAIQVPFDLGEGQSRRIIFRLGVGRSLDDASAQVLRLRRPGTAGNSLDTVRAHWRRTLGVVQVQTPDPALDVLANGWLLYQTIACRMWGRSGAYQSGGAFGFRDQLQDAMALLHAQPRLLRDHLLLCASRQFREGDVQHWWHPPAGRGVRTSCSDDYLWLPLAVCRYVQGTGDASVFDESVQFLDGRALGEGEESYYDLPLRAAEAASLYQHCVRAIDHGLRFGVHGLPLIGGGDWNDGMNRVGVHGRGESVWLGFFLFDVLTRFAPFARARGDEAFAQRCTAQAESLRTNLELHGWDGQWYRRAYFDDGRALGSAMNTECQIDSIAQSWAVLSGAGDPARSRVAIDSLDRRLVRRDAGLVQLLDPPFDHGDLDPGYIRGYVPGVRENGGQYTHAAIWAAMAFAAAGDNLRAWEVFNLINPVRRGETAKGMLNYKVEPYVVAADVYSVAPHTGRGGWTWYTGSAGWMYRLIVESLLGITREGARLRIAPCLPPTWPGFSIEYAFGTATYRIEVRRGEQQRLRASLDGQSLPGADVLLVDDGQVHQVEIVLPANSAIGDASAEPDEGPEPASSHEPEG